jgi:hypothetical protein
MHRLVENPRKSYLTGDNHSSRSIKVTLYSYLLTCRISWGGSFVLWSFALFWMIKFIQYLVDIQRLAELQNFYHYLLEIQDVPNHPDGPDE